jgi:hypothetical protein
MAFFRRLMILFVFFVAGQSTASACDRCVRRSKAAYRASSPALDNGTYGRGSMSGIRFVFAFRVGLITQICLCCC